MKKHILLFFVLITVPIFLHAQNVGIGTTNPDEKLTVVGTIKSNINSDADFPHLLIHEMESEFGRIKYTNTSSPQYFTLAGNPQRDSTMARFHINNSEFGNIGSFTGHGRFGINATNPAATFHLRSQPNTDLLRIQNQNNTKFRIFSNNAMVFGSNWATPIPDVIRFNTPNMFIGFDGNHVPQHRLEVDGHVKMNKLVMIPGAQQGKVLTSNATGIGTWQNSPGDADADPTNEIQTISKSLGTVTLSDGGGSFVDSVKDADSDPTNEIQTLSRDMSTITLSGGGGSFFDRVDDKDADPNNEIQTISKSGNTVTLSDGGGSFLDDDTDADASPTNELQTLSLSGSDLSISSGNTITLPVSGGGGTFISDPSGNEVVETDMNGLFPQVLMKVDGANAFSFIRPYGHPSILFSGTSGNISLTTFSPPFIGSGAESNVSIGKTFQATTISGTQNVIIGEHSGADYSGDENVIIGNRPGGANRFRNVLIGPNSGQGLSGNSNVCIGSSAGNGADGNCIYIGRLSGPNGLGTWSNSVGIGAQATITQDQQIVFGSTLLDQIGAYEPWSNLSDGRFKRNIKNNVPGLAFINALKPVTYTVDVVAIEKFTRTEENFRKLDEEYISQLISSGKKEETGFIAQEVEKAAKALNYNFDGVVPPKNEKDPYALAYSQFVVPLVKAVQELDEKNQILEKHNSTLENELHLLRTEIDNIKKMLGKIK